VLSRPPITSTQILQELVIDPSVIAQTVAPQVVDQYIATINWLNAYVRAAVDQVPRQVYCLLQSFQHLWNAGDLPRIEQLLLQPHTRELLLRRRDYTYANEQIELFQQLLAQENLPGQAICIAVVGMGYNMTYRYKNALSFFQKSLRLLLENNADMREIAWLHSEIGGCYLDSGNNKRALDYFRNAQHYYRQLGDAHAAADLWSEIAYNEAAIGETESAQRHFQESIHFHEMILHGEDRLRLAEAHLNYAHFLNNLLEIDEARVHLRKSLALFRRLKHEMKTAWVLYELGNYMIQKEKLYSAHVLYKAAFDIFDRLKMTNGIYWTLHCLGRTAFKLGDYPSARRYHTDQIKFIRGNPTSMLACIEGFAYLAIVEDQLERAVRLFGYAEKLREDLPIPRSPALRVSYEKSIRQLQQQVEPTQLRQLWDAGREMTMEAAAREAVRSS
jgi:tetratricopeptide (TPR) repeat protein